MGTTPFDWDRCIELIHRGQVVPVLGHGVSYVEGDAGPRLLYDVLGEKLAEALGQEGQYEANAREPFLRTVAMRYLRHDPQRDRMGRELRRVWSELDLAPCDTLRRLAGIDPFHLYVSTTFDPLLIQAVNEVRFGGQERTLDLAYSPKRVEDLPPNWRKDQDAIVYRLLGRLSPVPDDFALSTEDVLEFLHTIPARRKGKGSVKNLLNALEKSHLLLLGCGFSSWQASYVIRTLTGSPLSTSPTLKTMADAGTDDDSRAVFLGAFGVHVYEEGDARSFVEELAKRWEATHARPRAPRPPAPDEAQSRVFISYAHEDLAAADALRETLQAHEFDVWMDRRELKPAADWDRKIKQAIRGAAAFIPCISRNTEQERGDSYVFSEWALAMERARGWAPLSRFVWPVVFDDTKTPRNVPEPLLTSQWTHCPGGRPPPQFLDELAHELCGRNLGDFEVTPRDE